MLGMAALRALAAIAATTLGNATAVAAGMPLGAAEVTLAAVIPPPG